MKILSGLEVKVSILKTLQEEVNVLKQKNINLCLAIILNNDTHASELYVRNKIKLCDQLGIEHRLYKLENNTTTNQMIELINKLNNDKTVNGLFVQLPTGSLIDDDKVIDSINPIKDVDCFHKSNIGSLTLANKDSNNLLKPCTPAGIIEILKYYNIQLKSKHVVIINRSRIVGKPLISLFLQNDSTVTICHSKTKDLKSFTKQADIVICAIGKENFFDQSYFKEDATIIDVSINKDDNNKTCGDVNISCFDTNFKCAITPVPGGVGPLTVTMLLNNLIFLTKKQNKLI